MQRRSRQEVAVRRTFLSTDIYDIYYSLVYDPLIHINPDTGEYAPGLVKQWIVTEDSREWTLYLREDVYFIMDHILLLRSSKTLLIFCLHPYPRILS